MNLYNVSLLLDPGHHYSGSLDIYSDSVKVKLKSDRDVSCFGLSLSILLSIFPFLTSGGSFLLQSDHTRDPNHTSHWAMGSLSHMWSAIAELFSTSSPVSLTGVSGLQIWWDKVHILYVFQICIKMFAYTCTCQIRRL